MTGHGHISCSADLVLRDEPEQRRALEQAVIDAAEHHGYPPATHFALKLALEEAVMNAFKHGHKDLPGQPIKVSWRVEPARITITVEDRGPGFTPGDVPDPTTPEALEKPSGRGLMLMHSFMSRIEYNAKGNRVTMIYEKPA